MMKKDGDLSRDDETTMTSSPDGSVLMSIPIVSAMEGITVGEDGMGMVDCGIKTENDEPLEGITGTHEEEEVEADITQMLTSVSGDGHLAHQNQSTLQSLLSTSPAVSQVLGHQNGIQVIAVPTNQNLMQLQSEVPASVQILPPKYFGVFAIANPTNLPTGKVDLTGLTSFEMMPGIDSSELGPENMAAILMSQQTSSPELPPGCPTWAGRLKKCEKIGDSYRGYVENEVNLDLVLTLHKQQTNSFWGTRQSPSTAKTSTRLMWKSQYVPFDGIPFINAGSRAVVMECQYGPRRKGTGGKRSNSPSDLSSEFKQTCPARIYIKKVRKFPDYAVNLNMDKKNIRLAMDKAFHELREKGSEVWGEDRFYVQLPTEKAHDYHEGTLIKKVEPDPVSQEPPDDTDFAGPEARIHPAVLEKIRHLVAGGETKLYAIRKQLRKFVVRDLFHGSGHMPERHDLTVFPTVNDLKNHIHQALTDIQNGALLMTSPQAQLCIEEQRDQDSEEKMEIKAEKSDMTTMWSGTARPETVTVTLTQNPGEDGHHIISRIETHLSDGTTQISSTLTPETAQILSRLHPTLFRTEAMMEDDETPTDATAIIGQQSVGSSSEHPMSGIDTSQVIDGLDPSQLSSIVDFGDPHAHISAMMDSHSAVATISDLVNVAVDPSQSSISAIHHHHHHMDASTVASVSAAQNMVTTGIVDSECANLASLVAASDPHHHHDLQSLSQAGRISVLGGMDAATISKMVSTGTTHLSIIAPNGHAIDTTIALTSQPGDGPGDPHQQHTISLQPVDASHFISSTEGELSCVPVITKSTHLGNEEEDGGKLVEDEKITLHMTSDQDMGVTRLENQVSVL